MKKNTFLNHLNALSQKEVNKFEQYLKATYSNSKLLLRTFDYYKKFHNKDKTLPDFKIVFQVIFEKEHQKESDTRNLQNSVSDLFQKLKEYLIQKRVLKNEPEKEFLWLQILEERGLEHQKELHLKNLKKPKKGIKNIWEPIHQLRLHHYEFFRNDFQKNDADLTVIQNGMEHLDKFYTTMKLKYASEILNREYVLSLPPSSPFLLEPILTSLKKKNDLSTQNNLYFLTYIFLQKRTYKELMRLKEFVESHESSLNQEERLTALVYMLNFMAAELKKGKNYGQETFELYQLGLGKDKLLIHNNLIDNTHFFNLVNVACRLEKFSWVKKFINDFKKYLKEETRNQNISNAFAIVFFEEGEFQKVIDTLSNVNFKDVLFEMVARTYILASHYELAEDFDQLERNCDSFIRFVKRNKNLGELNSLAAINFAKKLKQLVNQSILKSQLKKEIKDEKSLFFRAWLLKKANNYSQIK